MSVITITPEAVMFGSVAFAPGVSWLGWLEEQVVGPVQALTLDTDDPRRVM
ncbi:hypothetical protein GCM10009716_41470 [Streptomyces sodiiphilus]|uniref:Uncharacterized protein n=1 Tax=Streptomyces sodiiphilus TaxID=226217 RepID=A0ABN2PRN2_9ACTN